MADDGIQNRKYGFLTFVHNFREEDLVKALRIDNSMTLEKGSYISNIHATGDALSEYFGRSYVEMFRNSENSSTERAAGFLFASFTIPFGYAFGAAVGILGIKPRHLE